MSYKLLGLDMRLVKPYVKSTMLLIFIAGPVFAFAMKSIEMMVMYIGLSAIMALGYPFTVAENKNGHLLYDVLPVSKKQVVLGRYLYVVALAAIAAVIMAGMSLLMMAILGQAFTLGSLLNNVAILAAALFVIAAYQLPLFFKMGYMKARIWSYAPFMFLGALGTLLPQVVELDLGWIINISPAFYLLAACALLAVSYLISCKIYK